MALSINNYLLKNGLIAPTTYIIVDYLNGTQNTINFNVNTFISKKAKEEHSQPIEFQTFQFESDTTDSALNIFKQAYEHLKSLDQYKNAMDILEDGQSSS